MFDLLSEGIFCEEQNMQRLIFISQKYAVMKMLKYSVNRYSAWSETHKLLLPKNKIEKLVLKLK